MNDLFSFAKNNVLPLILDYEPTGSPYLVLREVEQFWAGEIICISSPKQSLNERFSLCRGNLTLEAK